MSQKNENNEKNINQENSIADNKPKVIIKKNNNNSNNEDNNSTAAVKKVKKVIVKKKIIIHNKSEKQEEAKDAPNLQQEHKNFNKFNNNKDSNRDINKTYNKDSNKDFNNKEFNKDYSKDNNSKHQQYKNTQIAPPPVEDVSFKKDTKKDNKKRDYEKKEKEYDKKSSQKDSKAEAAQRQENKIFNKMQAKKLQQEQRLASVEKEISIMETITVGDLPRLPGGAVGGHGDKNYRAYRVLL